MNSKKSYLFLKLPLSLALCVTTFFYIEAHYLAPKLNPEQVEQALSMFGYWLYGIVTITPGCFILLSSFYLMLRLVRFTVSDVLHVTPFLFIDLHTALVWFIPIMLVWFFPVSQLFLLRQAFSLDSAIAVEAWGVLGVFYILCILMVSIFLKGYLLMLYYRNADSISAQNKARNFKETFLCFISSVFVVIIIMVFI